jgi:cytochrome c oxidase assembly protein subunit 15
MDSPSSSIEVPARQTRPFALAKLLFVVAAMVFAMVVIGGITRLTESGLSITEWNVISGTVPPLSHADWVHEFQLYQQTPQYQQVAGPAGMDLAGFKFIFFWEWAHRFLGRLVGLVFFVGVAWFAVKRQIPKRFGWRLAALFVLGGLQGAVGWWMVASGLTKRVEVSQYRLATHLVLALLIFAAIVWTVRRLSDREPSQPTLRLRITSRILLVLVFVQLYFGALVAGLRAGKVFNTWPSIDGGFIPSSARLFFEQPWWRNFFDNTLTVQFEHRMMAYTLFALAILHAADAVRSRAGAAVNGALWLAAAITVQATLGILTLLYEVPISLGLVHQAVAILVLTLAVMQAERLAVRQGEPAGHRLGLPLGQTN